ncbi:MAG TPA: redoxin domain-containing protein [Bacteroidia bacterium]|jgi:peroxiredoxin|nr:redoxin domain-containing protein [Bacteroidia bacterium]
MLKLRIHLAFFFSLLSLATLAQQIVITGNADTYKGKTIAAYSYQDYITNTPVIIASDKISDSGRFTITLTNIKTCQYLYLNIENFNGSIYVAPGKSYQVIFPPPDSLHYQNPFVTHIVDLVFVNNKASDINSMVSDFNDQWDLFWRKYYTYFVRKEATSVLDSFRITMQQRYSDVKDEYFLGYLNYTIAEIEINILVGQKTLGNKYLKSKPVLYHNYEYMKFFNDYFKDYLGQFALERSSHDDDVNRFIKANDYANLVEVMKINPILRSNDSLCELVLLKGLYELYYGGDYDKDNIKAILKNISVLSKIDEDKLIARNILNSFTEITGGNEAPEFTLRDMQGDQTSLIDFRGKYLYLCFFKSSVSECMSELDVMSALRRQYGKKINFVCISEDDNYADLQKFLDQNKIYNWQFLYDEGRKVLKQYDVKTLPEFFLINPKGHFLKSPADPPSHGIQQTFDIIASHKK